MVQIAHFCHQFKNILDPFAGGLLKYLKDKPGMAHCCLWRRFNHNYYASNHQIAEDHFPIFVRRFIQIAKVTVRRPKLLMSKMPHFKKGLSQNVGLAGVRSRDSLHERRMRFQLSKRDTLAICMHVC